MKLFIFVAFLGLAAAGYAPSGAAYSQESSRPQAAQERNARILALDSDVKEDSFKYNYETENGIKGEEQGRESNGIEAQGGYQYTGDDGQIYSVSYNAGEGGFQPQGAHLPVAPPTPEAILEALAQNARDEAAGIIDDGLYNPGKYGDAAPSQQYNAAPQQQYQQQKSQYQQKSSYKY